MTYAVAGKFAKQKGLDLARDKRKQDARTVGFKDGECPEVVERGPWRAAKDGKSIASDDFTHDVVLAISGDFWSDEQRIAYARELARRLTAASNAKVSGAGTASAGLPG